MEEGLNVQKRFFHELKTKLPSNLSLATVVADELNVSIDSAYRRIRGESDLSLHEFDLLSSKFDISTESVLSKNNQNVLFSYRSINQNTFDFGSYFQSLIEEIKSLEQYGLKEIIYAALDLPMFYYFMFPKLAAFKLFFWRRNVFNYSKTDEKLYKFTNIPEEELSKSLRMARAYLKVPTTEIWSEETLNSTLRQINFYYEMGLFESHQEIVDILNDLRKVIDHVRKQAEFGLKFNPDLVPADDLPDDKNNFKIYHNEVTLSDNVIIVKLENFNVVHLGHNVLNILTTSNEKFCSDAIAFVDKVVKNSTLISVSAEKERNRFFNILSHKIDAMAANI